MQIIISFLSFLMLFPIFCLGQNFSMCKHLKTENGLPVNGIRAVIQDKQGFIWIATFDGLCRYDGKEIITYQNIPEDNTTLSNNRINGITEDLNGNIWVATRYEGLSVFDRKKECFVQFNNNPQHSNSLSSKVVWAIRCDKNGNIWVGTWDGGLELFNPKDSSFIHFGEKQNLKCNNIYAFEEDDQNQMWIGSDLSGIDCINLSTFKIKHFEYDFLKRNIKVNCLLYENGILWIGTREFGLCKFNVKTLQSEWYVKENVQNPKQENIHCVLKSNNIMTLFNKGEKLWIGVEQNGIDILNKVSKLATSNCIGKENIGLISTTYFKISTDKQGNIWMAGSLGIDILPRTFSNFKTFKFDPLNPQGLSGPNLTRIIEDSKGCVWIGTDKALNKLTLKTGVTEHYFSNEHSSKIINSEHITALFEDSKKQIWIGTFSGGLHLYDYKNNTFKAFTRNDKDSSSILSNTIWNIFEDSKGNFWVGTDAGLELFDRKTLKFTHIKHKKNNSESLSDNRVTAIAEDKTGVLWFGTVYGLNKMNPKKLSFSNFFHKQDDKTSIPSNLIRALYVDDQNNLWIGTENGGLSYFNTESEKCINYLEKDGLPNTTVNSIRADLNSNLWIGTPNGLVHFDVETKKIKVFSEAHGLQAKSFSWNSACALQSGQMVFGGLNGYTIFHPDSILKDTFSPQILITRLKINDQIVVPKVPVNGQIILNQAINTSSEIELSYQNNNLIFEFQSSNFDYPEAVNFAYRLTGFKDEWIQVNSKHPYAMFNSLPPGDYEFQLKASNCDGIWSKEIRKVNIHVKAPFWMRSWFPFLISLVFFLILIMFYQGRLAINKKKELALEKMIENRTIELQQTLDDMRTQKEYIIAQNEEITDQNEEILKQKILLEEHKNSLEEKVIQRTKELTKAKHELDIADSLKTAFLQNISHEIRTPMNAIVGYTGIMVRRQLDKTQMEDFKNKIEQNVDSLTKVLDDILYISHLQTGGILVEFSTINITPILSDLLESFMKVKQESGKEHIDLLLKTPNSESDFYIDTDSFALKQVLWNIISNGLKYTDHGKVTFGYHLNDNNTINFFVQDTGVGIQGTDLNKIYELFRKLESPSDKQFKGGIGLGLSISEKLVHFMGGTISVDSQPGIGSLFTISFPILRINDLQDVTKFESNDWFI